MSAATKACSFLLCLLCCLPGNAQRYTVLIHEIMADPQPVIGLPEAEYIELKNTTGQSIDLSGWRLQTATATSSPFPAYLLPPDSLVIVTSRTQTALFAAQTIGVTSFPALSNTGSLILLTDKQGSTIHAVQYQRSWYQNDVKAGGGWSLEMMDATNPCVGAANWVATTDPSGGTPGKPNSVQARNPDGSAPRLISAIAKNATQLILLFDEPMDSTSLSRPGNYLLEPDITIVAAQATDPLFQVAELVLDAPLQAGKIYTLRAVHLSDCKGNRIHNGTVQTGLPQQAQKEDLVINELLFDSRTDGTDYVELYNRSKKIIDVSRLWMTHMMGSTTAGLLPIAVTPKYLFPGGYLLLTEDEDALVRSYHVKEPQNIAVVAKLPSLPDDKGSFVLLNEGGDVIDEVQYSNKWHFGLMANAEGVALERIDPEQPAQDKNNWTSAAATAGFGTPTYRNSQYRQSHLSGAVVAVSPKVFSPDSDGFDDFCTISYEMAAPNFVANLFLFDAAGRKLRHLVQNQTLSQQGFWRWDGTGENGQTLGPGIYILLLELFNLEGKKQQFKLAVSLARR